MEHGSLNPHVPLRDSNTIGADSRHKGKDAIDAWIRFYEEKSRTTKTVTITRRLSQYNEFVFHKIAERLAWKLQSRTPVRLWSAGSGIDRVSLRLKALYGDSVEITIFDVSEECIFANRDAFDESNLKAEFIVGNLFEANYANRFDIVFNTGLLEHFDKQEKEALMQVFSRSLRPGGDYITYVPYAGSRLYEHCMRSMKSRGVWPYGPEIPVRSFRHLESGDLILVEEFPVDALHQLTFLRPAHPLTGRALLPVTAVAVRFPHVFEPLLMRLLGGSGLYAWFHKPPDDDYDGDPA